MSKLERLAQQISENASVLNKFLVSKGLPQLSFDEDAPTGFHHLASDPKVAEARAKLANDARKVYLLTCGDQAESFRRNSMNVRDIGLYC
jgi:hypothetical protein